MRHERCAFTRSDVDDNTPMSAPDESKDQRLKQAEKISNHPEQYKVCEGCGSIVVTRAVTCPSCHAYKFDATAIRVVAQAKDLAMRTAHSVLSSDLT
ncbi:hypothetical protein EI77_02111 [Prosthecobacter fusiformis]|uniref:Uncharacterized protein n=2 Tax=Prosthecobacter fusiformis TaxID=48464 RepID=A0A4V3FFI9_9BACT|nr:hypothetical protein EI77_02111 [Prosthecobacter fusiformis]